MNSPNTEALLTSSDDSRELIDRPQMASSVKLPDKTEVQKDFAEFVRWASKLPEAGQAQACLAMACSARNVNFYPSVERDWPRVSSHTNANYEKEHHKNNTTYDQH